VLAEAGSQGRHASAPLIKRPFLPPEDIGKPRRSRELTKMDQFGGRLAVLPATITA